MASDILQARFSEYKQYIDAHINDDLSKDMFDNLKQAAMTAFFKENDREYGLKITEYAKYIIDDRNIKRLTGGNFWVLEKWSFENKQNVELLNWYYEILLLEAQNRVFDSYLLYLEKNREPEERFYAPKRKQFLKIGLIDAFQELLDDKLDILSISLPPGTGKGSHPDDLILTPNGYMRFGDIKVGTEVIAGNGNITKVIGVYPQGKRKFYKFTFDDGSSCRVSDNHLWKCQTRTDRVSKKGYRIVETSDMLKNFKVESDKRCNYSIDYVPKIDFEPKNLKIEPYLMGVLLGDGNLTNTPIISTPDAEIFSRVSDLLIDGYKLKHKSKYDYIINGHEGNNAKNGSYYSNALKEYDLYGKKSDNKFIPKDYLYANYEQRLELLRGLLDTDGFASKTGIEYTTVSKQLADDVTLLVHSLGGYCSISKKNKAGYKNSDGEFIKCKEAYRLIIQFSANQPSPFHLFRKANIYKPKREELKRFITNIEYIGDFECNCIMVEDECHLYITNDYIITHNTTLEKFFHSGICGWFPKDYNLFFSHSADITRMYYDGVLSMLQDTEYTWNEIFPDLAVTSTNAKMMQINIGPYKPFQNLMTASVGSEMAGKVRANRFLMVDDMIGKIEEALNKNTLDKLWNIYSTDARQRKVKGCKELHVCTRWSVHDVVGRLQRAYEGNERCKFVAVPDIDPVTEKSNFNFEFHGFDEQFFHDQELLMDEITYKCLFKNEPIEREGLLYHEDELRRYLDMPMGEPDAILGVCDTKSKGTDFLVLPVMYQYGDDYYMADCICTDNSDYGVQYQRMANMILNHNMQQVEFESNAGGDRVAFEVDKLVKNSLGRCHITTKPTETNKETRIIVNADWVKRHCLFKDKSLYPAKSDYGVFMSWLLSYSVAGRNVHDDIPDCMANFALYVTRKANVRRTTIISGGLF